MSQSTAWKAVRSRSASAVGSKETASRVHMVQIHVFIRIAALNLASMKIAVRSASNTQ